MKHIKLFENYCSTPSGLRRTFEGYDDVGIEYTKNKAKKLGDYLHVSDSTERYKSLNSYVSKEVIGNYTYLHFKYEEEDDDWYLWGNVKIFDNEDGTEIANASYGKEFEYSDMKCTIDVRSDKRRLGVGSSIYEYIERITGDTIHPDLPHSKKAELFWANPNRKFGVNKNN